MTSNGSKMEPEVPASSTTGPHSLPDQRRNRVQGQREGHACYMRKTPSPGTRRTPHSSHRHWAPPYWTSARPPPRANHRGAKVSEAPPNQEFSEKNLKRLECRVRVFLGLHPRRSVYPAILFSPTPLTSGTCSDAWAEMSALKRDRFTPIPFSYKKGSDPR